VVDCAEMERKPEIVLAEDEPAIREGLAVLFESEGYAVRTAANGEEALARVAESRPDLLLLDVMMPKKNGYAVCAEVRKADAELPILFLTAKDGDADELRGLSLGADDYVSKTASEQVLLARIAAALRRAKPQLPRGSFAFGSWQVDAVNLTMEAGGRRAPLSLREVELLRTLSDRPGELFARDSLVAKLWGRDFEGGDDVLTVAVSRLREKLGADAARIRTVSGKGYSYDGK